MEPKSGKLHKLGSGLFGPKWTEKWVHLDGTMLKCFPMAVEQQVFSLGSSRQSSSYELMDYKFAVADDKKVNRKFAFQLEAKAKSSKPVTFACSSEKELAEWRFAITSRLCLPADAPVSPVISEKIRRAAEAFSEIDPRNTGKIDAGKLSGLLRTIGWEGKDSELTLMKQQLDLGRHGVITRSRLLTWLQSYYCAQEVMARVKTERPNNQVAVEAIKPPEQPEKPTPSSSSARVSASKRLLPQGKADWDQRYSALRSSEPSTDMFTTGSEVSGLLAEFRQAAEIVVSEIVAEMALEGMEKTLQRQSLEGDEFFATDGLQQYRGLLPVMRKFHRDGLLVYLCTNSSPSVVPHEKKKAAASVAIFHRMVGHQVRAARALLEAIEESNNDSYSSLQYSALQIPLQCTIDHLGFRALVIASTDPAVKSTRKNLGGQATKNRVKQLNDQLKLVFDNLGLLTESLHAQDDEQNASPASNTVPAFFPVSAGFTVESRDGATVFKLQNLVDLIPADISSDEPDAIAHEFLLYKMRPEFVRMHGNNLPLHSNTHMAIEQDPTAKQRTLNRSQLEPQLLKQSAISAQECLHTVIIPEFVADLESGTVQVIDSRSLTRALHGEGINVRYLASCYELASLKHIRRALLAEMVARACKVEFRASLRTILPEATAAILRQAKASGNSENCESNDEEEGCRRISRATARALAKIALQEEASQVTVEFFNLVLGTSSPNSKIFWEERILPQLYAKFGISREVLNLDTIISEDLLHMPQLFHALQVQTGVYFSDHMNYNFKGVEPIARQNILCISPCTTLLARTTVKCERVLENADAFLAARELSSALSSIMFHIAILETSPSDERNLSLCHLLTCAANISLAMNLPDRAKQLATLAIEESPSNHAELARAYTILMKLKHSSSDLAGAQECFAKALEPIQWHLGPVHPLLCDTYMTMTEILVDLGEPEQAVEILQSCVALVRDCFGKTSLLYADIRRQQGMLMLAANPIDGEAIIGVLEDAISVYEKHFQDPVEDVPVYKEFAAECCYILATLRSQVSGSQAAEAAYGVALTGLALRKEVLPPNHEEIMKSYLQLGNLSRELGEHYRAVDYFKPALSILKMIHDDEHIDHIRSVTQTMLQLHLDTLSLEKRDVVDKTAKRFAQQWPRFALLSTQMLPEKSTIPGSDDDTSEESALLIFVMKKLFQFEPIEYVDQLIEKADLEFQDYRKQYNLNFAGTLRRGNADALSPLRSSSGRFASFSGAGTFSPPGSPRAPLSPMRHPTLFPTSPRGRTSFNQLDCNFLKTSTGDFSFGAQLASVLFLIDYPIASNTPLTANMAPVPAWTREWRPLARQLCEHISGNKLSHEEEKPSLSKETLLLRADRVVGQLYFHRFVDTLPQDVLAQTQALATKFRVHSLEDRAEKLLDLAPRCDHQVLKLLLELARSPTTATDQEVAVDLDSKSRWKTVLQQQQLKLQQQKLMQDQLVEELFQISTNDEWYQAWDDSDDDESDWDMGSADDSAVESERSVDTRQRNAKRSSGALEEEGAARQQKGDSDSSQQAVRQEMERKRMELSDQELQQDEILCRYYPEVSVHDMEVDEVDPTCDLDTKALVPFTLERPWLLCQAVVKCTGNTVTTNDIVPSRLIHEETVVRMIFEALHGIDSLLFEFHPVRPSPSIFSIDFQTKIVERSRRSLNFAIGHISPLALQHTLDNFTQAATELQQLRDFLGFIRRARDLSVQHRCVTLEGLANALSDVIRSLTDSICSVEQQTNATTELQEDNSSPWSGINHRQPTLIGIYGGLKEIFKMVSWLKGVLVDCFKGLSDRRWHEVKRAEQAKCVLDSLYRIMELEYVEGVTGDETLRTVGRLSRSDVLLHLFIGALNPYLDLLNRMVFERGHFESIPLDGELFFATPASMSVGASPIRERFRSFREGLMMLAPFKVSRSLVPTFLESMIPLLNEALASRQLKNRYLQHHQHTSIEPVTRLLPPGPSLHESLITELKTMGCTPNRGIFSVASATEEDLLSSQQIMLECVPFNRILERCLTDHLESKCRELNGEITDIFRDKLNYMEHVEALRRFVLMEQQDVFNIFSQRLVDHMQENPVAWADSEKINSFHQSAVQGVFEDNSLSSSQRQIGGRLSVRVDFSRLDTTTSGARIDIATMKCLHFTFAAQQPLRVLFSVSIMQKYSRLGVFLVQVKAVESALVKFKSTLRHRRSYSYIEKDMRQLLIQSADMLHYTKSLLTYLTSQISSNGWSKYRDILRSSRSLAEMDTTHEQYLDHLLNRFFLLDKHATVIQYILTTFNHILRFVRQVDEFVSAVDRNMQTYFPGCWSEEDSDKDKVPSVRLLEHPDFRVLQSEMARSAKEFKRQSHFLVVMLTAMQKHGASPHVNEIVTQLNYNYFYHQQENRALMQPQVQRPRPVKQANRAQTPPLNRSGSLRPPPALTKYSRTRSVQLS